MPQYLTSMTTYTHNHKRQQVHDIILVRDAR